MNAAAAKTNVMISNKGQITLPASMRKALGLTGENAIVTVERRGNTLVLTPAIVVETDLYSDADIAEWNRDDAFAKGERQALDRKLRSSRR